MKHPENIFKYFLYASLIILGIVIGIAIRHYYNLPIEQTINIVDLGTLVVTVFLAVYIPEVLDRKLQVKRDKKDLIEKRIDELQSLFRKINMIVQGQEPLSVKEFLYIQNTLDVAKHKLETIVTLLTYSNMHTSFTPDIEKLRELSTHHRELLWSDKIPEAGFAYPDEIQQEEESYYNRIDEATGLLIFKISEA